MPMSTLNEATGFLPFYLLYGRSSHLPIDSGLLRNSKSAPGNHKDYVEMETWNQQMKEACELKNLLVMEGTTVIRKCLAQPSPQMTGCLSGIFLRDGHQAN